MRSKAQGGTGQDTPPPPHMPMDALALQPRRTGHYCLL